MPMVLLNLNLLLKHISPSLLHHHHLQLKNLKLKYYMYSPFAAYDFCIKKIIYINYPKTIILEVTVNLALGC